MSERPEKRKVEFIESYWTGGEHGADYVWNDNHGELVRCKDCQHSCDYTDIFPDYAYKCIKNGVYHNDSWFCADGERR